MDGVFDLLRECLRAEVPVALATVIEVDDDGGVGGVGGVGAGLPPLGAKLLVRADIDPVGSLPDPELSRIVARDAHGALMAGSNVIRHYGRCGEAGRREVTVFIEVFSPPSLMLIFGAVDFSAALVRLGKVLGYHVTVCDARPAFATVARFPEADEVVADWPHRYLAKVADTLGPSDAVCVLTHDHKFDIPVLIAALDTGAGYIGAMGSRATHEDRTERLRAHGVAPEQIQRIVAPIGLDIGSRTPEETAVSICAEIISLRAGMTAPSLRDGSGPIHRTTTSASASASASSARS
jgi:xanthine dehydrogenase accessory factor